MHKLFRLALALLASLAACFAVPAVAKPAPHRAAAPLARPALWKLADADTTIYLFGTIHVLPKGANWFNGEVARAFAASHELVTEVADTSGVSAATLSKAMLPEGQSLRGMMSPAERVAFEKALADLDKPAAALDRFEPWYAAIALSTLPLMKAGYGAENGVEAALDARAKALRRNHIGLETAEYQLGLFDSLPADVQKRYLSEIVEHMPTIRQELVAIVEEWKRGNAERLAQLMNADEDDPVLVANLITNRNRAWAQWIKARMDKPGVVFLAVGAGHLAGPGSLQDQLRTLGFTATRVQ
jgi:uncharacterized protein YbaP (TraB family)